MMLYWPIIIPYVKIVKINTISKEFMPHFSDNTRNAANKLGILFPTSLPLFRGSPNIDHLADWAESQGTPMARQIAHKMVDNLQYIAFEDFLRQLQHTIDDFHQRVNSESYVLLVGELMFNKLADGCSDLWLIGLALEHCGLKEPVAILTPDQLQSYRSTHPSVTNILMLDDASYSGTQKGDILDYFKIKDQIKANELSFFVGIPFMTRYAKEALSRRSGLFKELSFLNHVYMPSVIDVLDAKEIFYAKQANVGYVSSRQTLTYFDHRYADFFSCFQQIYDGSDLLSIQITNMMNFLGYTFNTELAKKNKNLRLITDPEQYNALVNSLIAPNYNINYSGYTIPTIIPPYRLHSDKTRQELNRAIESGKIGNRTPYPARDLSVETMLSKSILPGSRSFHYKKSACSLEMQVGYDNALIQGNQEEITYVEQVDRHKKHQQLQKELKTLFPAFKLRKANNAILLDIVNTLINNIETKQGGRWTSGINSKKVQLLADIRDSIAAKKQDLILKSEAQTDYLRNIMKVCEMKRNSFHFWATPASVGEYKLLLKQRNIDFPSEQTSLKHLT